MAEKIAFENGRTSNFQGLVTLTLTLDQVILHTVVHSFFRRPISEVTERISTKLGDILTYDCYLKNMVRTSRAFAPHGLVAKTVFGTDFELWPNILSLQRNMISTIKNLSIYRDSPTCPQIWWTLAQKRLRTVGEFLPTYPLHFRIGRHCQPYTA